MLGLCWAREKKAASFSTNGCRVKNTWKRLAITHIHPSSYLKGERIRSTSRSQIQVLSSKLLWRKFFAEISQRYGQINLEIIFKGLTSNVQDPRFRLYPGAHRRNLTVVCGLPSAHAGSCWCGHTYQRSCICVSFPPWTCWGGLHPLLPTFALHL